MASTQSSTTVLLWRVAILLLLLAVWQWAYDLRAFAALKPYVPNFLDPYFVSKPSEIWKSFLRLGCLTDRGGTLHGWSGMTACLAEDANNIWMATAVTLKNTFWGFLGGTLSGIAMGLILGRSDFLSRVFEPYIVAFNSIPRIALVPLIILMFGLGDISKIVTAWIVVFFVVFFNTFEGTRSVDRDQIAASRLLGANSWTVTRTVVIPSTLAWVFASLTPAVSFALIGVIVGEFIGAERGIGKLIVEAEARANASEMMVAIFVLMVVGILLAIGVRRIQAYLLRWQPQFDQASA
ncbi:ABC transporter permease [Microvirga sp. VF16]|uniref:ABC transporter permease n=1 Tax=Microvirga sp. VF16 TaxID=2807101 RepID=UPI00193CB5E4|nr:ABC transporter permease [Microvirga sp. VF16]QRM33430.1 ABC transporter permease [Microvirga sp. VF16]